MLKILLILSVLSLSHISVGKLITHLNDSNIHPCERVNGTGNIWAANPRGCDLYFYCEKYPAFIGNGQCPEGFHFDEPHQACNDQSLVGCDIDENLWGAECEETGYSKVAHPYSCSEFTVCFAGLQADFQCEDGKHFSPYDQDCVDPSIANCPVDRAICPNKNDFISRFTPSTRNCAAYYLCFNGYLQRFECGPGQRFDSRDEQCLEEGDSDCDAGAALPEVDLPSQLSMDCTGQNGTIHGHPQSCSFWFWCTENNSQLFRCGQGTLFDIVSRTCTGEDFNPTCYDPTEASEEQTDEPIEETTEDPNAFEESIQLLADQIIDMHQEADENVKENEIPMNFV